MIGKTVGHYRITSKLGAGGMGEVFLAQDTRLERKAAIKFLPAELAADPERRQRFLIEAKAASALNHPHVCIVYDVGETEDGLPFIAMEFVEGRSLDSVLKQGPLEISRSRRDRRPGGRRAGCRSCRRIVHRDIKPANISLNERGQVKVLDFGLAKRMPPESTDALGHDGLDAANPGGPGAGNAQLHESRAGPGQGSRSSHRSLQSGGCSLRTDDRPEAVRRPTSPRS